MIEHNLTPIIEDILDEKILFEIENEFEINSNVVKESFKDFFAQYVLTQLRMSAKKLRLELQNNTTDEHKILKQIELCKKLIHNIEAKDCQFINDMV